MGGIVFCDVAVSGVGVCGACVGGLKFCVWAVFELDTYVVHEVFVDILVGFDR